MKGKDKNRTGKRKKRMMVYAAGFLISCLLLAGCVSGEAREVRIGSLKGPTSIGLLSLMEKTVAGETGECYTFTMAVGADELLTAMAKGELDIALVPANVASILYQKTGGGVSVIDINTLGVLYMVSGDGSIDSPESLKGKTIYLTGKGTTPDFVLSYIMEENGISRQEYTLEYKSEAAEVAAVLAEDPDSVGLLPQPFVTAACMQNEDLKIVLDMNAEWDRLQGDGGSRLVTGVTIVRNAFLEQNEQIVTAFLKDHKESAEAAGANVERTAQLAEEAGIVAKAQIAQKAIPHCNITYMEGMEMKQALGGYLEVLYGLDQASVGGGLPGDDFYYVP